MGRRRCCRNNAPPLTCFPCPLPKRTLFVDAVNPVTGNYTVTLTFFPPGLWASPCTHGLLYTLSCLGGIANFGVGYFLSGSCPSGQEQVCSSAGAPPLSLHLVSWTCSPLAIVYTIVGAGCPVLGSSGYSQWTVRT